MSKIGTKYPSEKLEYWRQYRRDNAEKCRNQRRQWREHNRYRIRLCARRSYYRKLLHEGHGDVPRIQAMITYLAKQIIAIQKIQELWRFNVPSIKVPAKATEIIWNRVFS